MKGLVMRKWLTRILGVAACLLLGVLMLWILVAGPTTVFRIIRYGDTDIDDFSHYPGRELQPSDDPYRFDRKEQEVHIPVEALLPYGSEGRLARILEQNDSIAFLIIQGETILYERYFQGHTPSSLSQAFSMSKSFTSALIGMAIADGYVESVDQAITDFIPELKQHGFQEVKIEHLLTMTSGSSYVENDNPFGEHVILNYTTELEDRILGFEMATKPGEKWRYKSGDNALLALALDRALGEETIAAYAQRRVWTPLGMEHRGVWSIDHEGNGLEKTWCCLAAAAHDFAKLGRLYLNHGAWNGRQILPSDWVESSTSGRLPASIWPSEYRSVGWWNYGYQWWLASEEKGDYFALGKDGQILYLNPESDVIILRLGWSSGGLASSEWISMFQSIAAEIE